MLPSPAIPLSTRLGEISLAPAGHIGAGFGQFGAPGSRRGPLQASHFAQFSKGTPTGHGWAPGGAQPACGGLPQNRHIAASARSPPRAPFLGNALPRPPAWSARSPPQTYLRMIVCWLAACALFGLPAARPFFVFVLGALAQSLHSPFRLQRGRVRLHLFLAGSRGV